MGERRCTLRAAIDLLERNAMRGEDPYWEFRMGLRDR